METQQNQAATEPDGGAAPISAAPAEPPPQPRSTYAPVAHKWRWYDELFYQGFRHWLSILNTLVLLYTLLPWLSPLLIETGYVDLGQIIFHIYTPFCHQAAGSSFFLFDHQVAYCHRDVALYTSILVGGLIYGARPVRRYLVRHPLPIPWIGALLLPIIIDGGSHTLGNLVDALARDPNDAIWSLNWWLRMVTGALAGIAVVAGIYPRLDRDLRGEGEEERTPA